MRDFLLRLIPPQPWTPAMLSWLVVAAALGMYAQLLWFGNPVGLDPVILGRILGTLDTSFGLVLAFWLGSTKGAKDKDETIRTLATKREPWTADERKRRAK